MENVNYYTYNNRENLSNSGYYEEGESAVGSTANADYVSTTENETEYQSTMETHKRIECLSDLVKYEPSNVDISAEWKSKSTLYLSLSINKMLTNKNLMLVAEQFESLDDVVLSEINYLSNKICKSSPALNLKAYKKTLKLKVYTDVKYAISKLIGNNEITNIICKIMTSRANEIHLTEGITINETIEMLDYKKIFKEASKLILLDIGKKLDDLIRSSNNKLMTSDKNELESAFITYLVNYILRKCMPIIEVKTLDIISTVLDCAKTTTFLSELLFKMTLGVTMCRGKATIIESAHTKYYDLISSTKNSIFGVRDTIVEITHRINNIVANIDLLIKKQRSSYCPLGNFISSFPSIPKIVASVCLYEKMSSCVETSICYYEMQEFIKATRILRETIGNACPEALSLFKRKYNQNKSKQLVTDMQSAISRLEKIRGNFITTLENYIAYTKPLVIRENKIRVLGNRDLEVIKRNIKI